MQLPCNLKMNVSNSMNANNPSFLLEQMAEVMTEQGYTGPAPETVYNKPVCAKTFNDWIGDWLDLEVTLYEDSSPIDLALDMLRTYVQRIKELEPNG